jgi:outer membrane biosynthesis protein TonB
MRVAIAAVLLLAGLGLVGVAFAGTDGLRTGGTTLTVAAVEVRAYPAPDARPAQPTPVADPAQNPAEKPAEKPAEVKAAAPKPAEAKSAVEPKPAEAKAAEPKAAEPKPAPAAVAGAAKPPAPAAAEKKPAAAPAAPVAAEPVAAAEAFLNLKASDTADVYVDGKKAGSSPVLGYKVKPGKHKVRFDCYDASGSTAKGPEKLVEVRAADEKDVDHECTAEAKAPSHEESPY